MGRLRNRAKLTLAFVDQLQQRHKISAVAAAVVRKYADDLGGRLGGQIAYSAFLSVFPLLLLMLTGLGLVLHGDRHLQDVIANSAVRQFPVIGTDLTENLHQLSTGGNPLVVIVFVWLLYGAMRFSRSAQHMMAMVWDVGRESLPSFRHWLPRAFGFLAVIGVGFVVGGALSGLGAFHGFGGFSGLIGFFGSFGVNTMMFWSAFRIVLKRSQTNRGDWPGAILGGAAWTIMQFAGALLVNHQLRHLSNLYGTFATVLGLMWWLAIGAMIAVMAAELNVVLACRLWPRSIVRLPVSGRSKHQVARLAESPTEEVSH